MFRQAIGGSCSTACGQMTKYDLSSGRSRRFIARIAAYSNGYERALCHHEVNLMKRFLILSGLLLSTAFLIAPVPANADDRRRQEKRYYDRQTRDYHTWNDQEDRAYRAYLQEQRREYRDFGKVKRNQQTEYFRWRHSHPDNTLFKVEIR